MTVQRFIRWCETATSRQRADGFVALARSLADGTVEPQEREATIVALHLVAEDPSPKVRLAVAVELADAYEAPRSLVRALLLDNPEIAASVAGSPVLTSADLTEALARVSPDVQAAIAARPCLPAAVATVVAASAHLLACRALAANDTAALTPLACRRLARRFGADGIVRGVLLARDDLPADVRQTFVLEIGSSLETSAFVAGVLGHARAGRVAAEACERATAKIGEWVASDDIPDLVEHLRATGQISPAFLIRAACAGNIDLLAAALTALSGLSARRVRAVVVDCRDRAFLSLARSCGLDDAASTLLRLAVREWKSVATGHAPSGAADASDHVMQRVLAAYRRQPAGRLQGAVASLLSRLEGEIGRDSMRTRLAQMLAA